MISIDQGNYFATKSTLLRLHIVIWLKKWSVGIPTRFLLINQQLYTWNANSSRRQIMIRRTNACNTSDWSESVSDNTLLGTGTWVANNTRVLTGFSHACHLRRTINVNSTFRVFKFNGWKNKGEHMHSKSDSVWCIFCTYVLHKLHNHLLLEETCKNRFLCGC